MPRAKRLLKTGPARELDRHVKWAPLVAVAQTVWCPGTEKKAACGPSPWLAGGEGGCHGGRSLFIGAAQARLN